MLTESRDVFKIGSMFGDFLNTSVFHHPTVAPLQHVYNVHIRSDIYLFGHSFVRTNRQEYFEISNRTMEYKPN